MSLWLRILLAALRRNGWRQLFFYLSNLDVWRFMEYSKVYQCLGNRNTGLILDLGAGYSIFSELLPRNRYIAVDLSKEACQYQRSGKVDSVVADMRYLPFKSSSIPTVLAISSIEHVSEDSKVFQEIARVLAKDGIAIATIPFSRGETRIEPIQHPRSLTYALHRFKKLWRIILGEVHLNYFLEQTATDTIQKYYSQQEIEDVIRQRGLSLQQYRLFGKGLIRRLFKN
jgi:ubiquinone/menaquinone biosynthesis C-methylase UbiE